MRRGSLESVNDDFALTFRTFLYSSRDFPFKMMRMMMIHAKNCFIFITKSSVMKKIMSMLNLEMA